MCLRIFCWHHKEKFMRKISQADTIAQQIKEIRLQNNMSQSRFGKKIGVTGKAISSYETGRNLPSLKVLEDIANVFNVSLLKTASRKKLFFEEKLKILEKTVWEVRDSLDLIFDR